MKYRLTPEQERKLEQFARSNFAELFLEIFTQRCNQINKQFRTALPELFLETKGRALEIDELINVLKIKGLGD